MSTDQATEGPDLRPRTKCFMCSGMFVSHSEYEQHTQFPENICVWCYSRTDLMKRFMAMYHALQYAVKTHPKHCPGKCCVTAKAARKAYLE
jgi:hypothetical protein